MRTRGLAPLALLALAGCPGPAGSADAAEDADSTGDGEPDAGDDDRLPPALVDELGREVYHLGVNVSESAKWAPDLLAGLTDEELDRLAAWGVTLVRLLLFWEGVEPERGVWDDAYLARLRAELDRYAARDLAVLLDMHQDLFGRGFGFAGAPRWACDEAQYASFVPTDPWFLGYLSEEVEACFDAFWSDRTLWDHYRDACARAATTLGDHPAVVGFDLMNEPGPGTISSGFERTYLEPFYDHVAAGLAAAGFDRPLYLEPSVTYDFVIATRLRPFGPGEVFAPHYYPTFAHSGEYGDRLPTVREDLDDVLADAVELGAPLVLGEFGTRNDVPDGPAYLADVLDETLARGGSALVWDYGRGHPGAFSLLDPDGAPYPLHAALLRPFAHRVAGRLFATSYDRSTRTLELAWRETGLREPTVIVVPDGWGEPRFTSSDPGGSWSVEPAGPRRWEVRVDARTAVHTLQVAPTTP
jgi:endoglycosylceramidase